MFIISLMKALDIRSEGAVKLLAEFLDMDAPEGRERRYAEHFAHGAFFSFFISSLPGLAYWILDFRLILIATCTTTDTCVCV